MAYTDIDKPSDYFNTVLYSGDGGTQSVTGVGFQPDWSWLKCRSTAYHHRLFDVVRGAGKNLRSDTTDAEQTVDEGITAFNSNGFSVKQGSTLEYNASGQTYVSWNWKAGGSASSNSNGSITSSVSANTDAGFSIVSYTGNGSDNATIGHGLGSSIDFVIVKRRNTTSNWLVQGSKVGTGYGQYIELNAINAIGSASDNIKSVSSSLLTLGTNGSCNGSSDTYIAYCFAEKKGYSKFGSYTGNGNADGTFVYTGFKPAFVMTKPSNKTGEWFMIDNKRDPSNYVRRRLKANSNAAENTDDNQDFDILSNGFKPRRSAGDWNSSGDTFIYMAFAENPFVTSTGVPATAR